MPLPPVQFNCWEDLRLQRQLIALHCQRLVVGGLSVLSDNYREYSGMAVCLSMDGKFQCLMTKMLSRKWKCDSTICNANNKRSSCLLIYWLLHLHVVASKCSSSEMVVYFLFSQLFYVKRCFLASVHGWFVVQVPLCPFDCEINGA